MLTTSRFVLRGDHNQKNGENILIDHEMLVKLIIVVIVSTAHCGRKY